MNSRPDFTDPFEAARVSTFMEPAQHGRWKIVPFTQTERMVGLSYAVAYAEGGTAEEREMRAARTIPAGTYVSLQRKATALELEDIANERLVDVGAADGDPLYMPVMSDTPAEIREHSMAIEDAYGDVVITGLGLGCIVSALLAKPEVRTITVVEIDRDVIALTGPYYADEPRVTIVNMDALKAAEAFEDEGQFFDYGWHDIWSHIADRNLDDDALAEHGISYETMFNAYSGVCDQQEAWAWHEARAMAYFRDQRREALKRWADAFAAADDDGRFNLLVHFHLVQALPQYNVGDDIPEDLAAYVIDKMNIAVHTRSQIKARGGLEAFAREIAERAGEVLTGPPEEDYDPMGRPNEVPEANVAR